MVFWIFSGVQDSKTLACRNQTRTKTPSKQICCRTIAKQQRPAAHQWLTLESTAGQAFAAVVCENGCGRGCNIGAVNQRTNSPLSGPIYLINQNAFASCDVLKPSFK